MHAILKTAAEVVGVIIFIAFVLIALFAHEAVSGGRNPFE